jgi:hypothetical protein
MFPWGVEMTLRARKAGGAYLLVLPPYYVGVPTIGLLDYSEAIGRAPGLPSGSRSCTCTRPYTAARIVPSDSLAGLVSGHCRAHASSKSKGDSAVGSTELFTF